MWLLEASSIELKSFPNKDLGFPDDKKLPPYAILSHTWETEEVLFADMMNGTAKGKVGYKKLVYSCKQAMANGLEYVWVDTCCINKDSSAELSEAINSMYAWYHKAHICYAYIADLPVKVSTLTESRWFTRGWTLQELIAPESLIFYSGDWDELGTKATLHEPLAKRTGIDASILTGERSLESASVARRMSWACNRQTTRTEDEAYCLMGLFNVNMPMLYGEGSKAFLRLQEEIMKNSDDESIFAWIDSSADPDTHLGLLADSPKRFESAGNVIPYKNWELSAPFSISNKGLSISLHLSRYEEDIYVAALDCPSPPNYEGFLGIYLKRITTGDHQYARVKARNLCRLQERGNAVTVYVRQSPLLSGPHDVYPMHIFQLWKGPTEDDGYKLINVRRSSSTEKAIPSLVMHLRWTGRMQRTFPISRGAALLAGALLFERHDGERLAVLLGSMDSFTVGFDVASKAELDSIEVLQKNFNPRPPGTNMVLDNHQVRVSAEPRIHEGAKFYLVDITIEPIYHSLNPVDLIMDMVPALQNEPDERPHNARLAPSRGFERIKSVFKLS